MSKYTFDLLLDIKQNIEKERKRIQKEADSLPYQINIIDELHVDERANSRILAKLFQFQSEKGKYEILQSFIDYLRENIRNGSSLNGIEIQDPSIIPEKEYIDIWIRDKKWAIIIENKIYNARDQESQLARYIETTIDDKSKTANGYKPEQIFVIYMPPEPHEPDDQTWKINKKNYKDVFQDRYFNISFEESILPWLTKELLPNIRQKDVFLSSAVMQYINYLDGMFGNRLIDKEINMETKKMIEEKLDLVQCKDSKEKIEKLNSYIKDTSEILESMEKVKSEYLTHEMKTYINNRSKSVNFHDDASYIYVDFEIKKVNYYLYVSEDSRYYCQLMRVDENDIQNSKTSKDVFLLCQGILPKTTPKQNDRMWKYVDSVDEAFECFKEVFDTLCENQLL